jgi:hypothetical protein
MLNVVGAKDDGAAHLAADPVLARFPQDQVLAHRKDRPSEVARHDVSRHPVRHRCSRRAIARPNAGALCPFHWRDRKAIAEKHSLMDAPIAPETAGKRRLTVDAQIAQEFKDRARRQRRWQFCAIGEVGHVTPSTAS